MKISVNLIRYYKDQYKWSEDPAPEGVDTLVERIGAQLGAVEETVEVGKKYDGVVVVKVVACEQHPNADRLHVCMVDDGGVTPGVPRDENGLVQVVCGAPNVHAGVTVAWLPPGVMVPSTYDTDPFILEARELRGVVSNGMLASPKELAIGDSHEGLLILDDDAQPGTMFADKYNLRGDVVIDIENKMFTHRPDCFGWMGVAREIAGIQGQKFTSPDWYRPDVVITAENDDLKVEVRNEIPELVPRFTAVPIAGVTVRESPVWLQVELARVGLRPINNIVDLTNYYMLLTGQPLHAYDYDKVVAQDQGADHATLVVRKPHDGEKLKLLSGKEVQPGSEAIMIATNTQAIGLGGVMGGGNTEVDDSTKNIILECATFDMYSIRRTSMANGIFSDAVTRFTKGQSPLQNMAVLAKITADVLDICGGKVAGQAVDDNHLPAAVRERKSLHPDVTVSQNFINERLGIQLEPNQTMELLRNVEFDVNTVNTTEGAQFTVRAPFWRTDIEIPEDIVEEVGRLHGFDKLPLELPTRSIMPASKNTELATKSWIREGLSAAGGSEVLTYSFVHGDLLDKAGQDKNLAYKLSNALSPKLQYYRLSLTPSLLDLVHANIKAGYDEFALFEIGKVHGTSEIDDDGLPKEFGRLALVYAAASKKNTGSGAAPYYEAKKYLETVMRGQQLSYLPLAEAELSEHKLFMQLCATFDPNRSAVVYGGDRLVGVVGEYKQSVRGSLKLSPESAGFEIFLSALVQLHNQPPAYVPLSRFPSISQDISLKVPADVTYGAVYDCVTAAVSAGDGTATRTNVSPLDIYQRAEDPERKQIALRISVTPYEKTLTDKEVTTMLDAAAAAAGDTLGAERL